MLKIKKLWKGVVNPSSRGRIRWALFFVLVLAVVTGLLDFARPWNVAADTLNRLISGGSASGQTEAEPPRLRVPHYPERSFRLGLDLQGGAHLVYEADVSQIESGERDNAVEGVRDVIERRVNAFGVSEPVVQTARTGEAWRVVVELAGVKDVKEAIRQIGETPVLEFKEEGTLEPARDLTADEKRDLEKYNAEARKRVEEVGRALSTSETIDWMELAKKYSEDITAKDLGGALGNIQRESAYGDLWQWADKNGVGKISLEPVENAEGWNFVRVNDVSQEEKEVEARHLLVCFRGADRCEKEFSKDEARAKIEELKAQATPENFEQLVKEHSTEPGASQSGGTLGWFGQGAMVKPFEDAAFALGRGQISEIVETQFGLHLIHKLDERPLKSYNLSRILIRKKSPVDYLPPPEPFKATGLSGKHLKRAMLQFDPNTNTPEVGLEFNSEGQKLFADITTRNVEKLVAIFLDGQPISVPQVQTPITDGRAVISGSFTIQEGKLLAQRLNAGALPVPISLISQQTVGATLGDASVQASLKAGLIGFVLVALFMIVYYRLAGVLAVLALLVYSAIVLALFKLIPVTLTLAGIAGFILSVGMAVDANVLQFERLKEELRAGKSIQSGIEDAFVRAWPSIRDSHLTTLFGALILFWFSTSLVKGFGLTLSVGVIVSLFSAITVTRVFLRILAPHVTSARWYGTKIKR